ncbi:hypothetical protein HDR59_04480 [bacterium]|nr:hypothetical protein [bacterium]
MANKIYSDDIFIDYALGKVVSISANESIPLNTIIDREKLAHYNNVFKSDVYFYFTNSNPAYVGFTKCNRDINVNTDMGNTVIGLNSNNIDEWCIKSNDEYYLVNNTIHKMGEIKVIGGNSIFCDVGDDKPRISWDIRPAFENAANNSKSMTSDKMKKVKDICGNLDVEELEKVYKMTVASSVTSGIGTVGSIASTVTSAISNNEQKKDDSDDKKVNGLNLATTISSAVGGVASGAGTVTSGIAASKLKKIISDIKACRDAIREIQ